MGSTDTAAAPSIYRVVEAFAYSNHGIDNVMRRGDVITDDHPAFNKGRLDAGLFEPVGDAAAAHRERHTTFTAVETATAPPAGLRATPAPTAATLVTDDEPPADKARTPRRAVKDQPQA